MEPSDVVPDVWDRIELQSAVLVRHFEMLRRRSDIYSELERAEYLLLRTLDRDGPADICGLASALGLDPSTAGRQVTTLAERGLVLREPSSADRRRSIVTLTEEGRDAMGRVRRQRRQATRELLAGWTEEERRVLADVFTRYNRTVGEAYLS